MFVDSRTRKAVLLVGILGVVILSQSNGLLEHVHNTFDPYTFNGDARQQIPPFYQHARLSNESSTTLSADYVSKYYLTAYFPLGYKLLFESLANISDPIWTSKVATYLLFACYMVILGATSYRISGAIGFFTTTVFGTAFVLHTGLFFGALPREFGPIVIALALYGFAVDSWRPIVAATLLGALFYPVSGLLSLVALGAYLFLYPLARTAQTTLGNTFRKRISLFGVTTVLALALVAPLLYGGGRYGDRVSLDDSVRFPEIGAGGRYNANDRGEYVALPKLLLRYCYRALVTREPLESYLARAFKDHDNDESRETKRGVRYAQEAIASLILASLLAVVVTGVVRRGTSLSSVGIRLLLFLLSICVAYLAAVILSPRLYLPERYVALPMPTFILVAFPVLISAAIRHVFHDKSERVRAGFSICLTLAIYGLLNGPASGDAGFTKLEGRVPFCKKLEEAPPNTLLAGWPRGLLNNVHYFCKSPVLVSEETHQIFHEQYALEMRRRMEALIRAYFAPLRPSDSTATLAPLIALRDQFGVTHLLVDLRHYNRPPSYFEPFSEMTEEAFTAGKSVGFVIPSLVEKLSIMQVGQVHLLELNRL